MKNQKNTENKGYIRNLVLLSLLSAVLILMAFTPIGYLKIGLLSITFNVIPVAIGAVAIGIKGGTILGFVFGVTSFIQCFGTDPFGTTLFGISPFGTIMVTVVARVLMGISVGALFFVMGKIIKNKFACFTVAGLLSGVLNTVFFMGFLILFFGETEYIKNLWEQIAPNGNALAFSAAFVTINAVFEWLAATLITPAILIALYKAKLLKLNEKVEVSK